MSNFPQWWDSTVTIYNKYTDPDTRIVTWYKTVLDNCFWRNVQDLNTSGNTSTDTFSLICRIPKNSKFKPSGEWLEDPNKNSYFTLTQGDIAVVGNCPDIIDEYQSGQRSSDLISKYHKSDSCMEIKRVAYNTMSGMLNPHYCIRGV